MGASLQGGIFPELGDASPASLAQHITSLKWALSPGELVCTLSVPSLLNPFWLFFLCFRPWIFLKSPLHRTYSLPQAGCRCNHCSGQPLRRPLGMWSRWIFYFFFLFLFCFVFNVYSKSLLLPVVLAPSIFSESPLCFSAVLKVHHFEDLCCSVVTNTRSWLNFSDSFHRNLAQNPFFQSLAGSHPLFSRML